jgi:signal transduction histidine kinase
MDFLLSLKKRFYIFRFITVLLMVVTFCQIVEKYKADSITRSFLLLTLFLYTVNNVNRSKFLKNKSDSWYFVSYSLSILLLGSLSFKIAYTGTAVYNILLLIELIVFTGKLNIKLLAGNFIFYIVSYIGYIYADAGVINLSEMTSILLNFFSPCLVLFLFRSTVAEKTNYQSLSKELADANTMLKDYADKIEELTKTQERNRIAQELHDSMGHSLMALKMNLEYAENVVDAKPDKAKEVIHKTQAMTKDCIENLRKVVSLLKDTASVEQLRVAINELFYNFKETNHIKFHLEMEDSIELEPPDIKNCIYKVVREAITNGIKHGNATNFYIDIFNKFDMISLMIRNNGIENEKIVKSNGIVGMEERVKALGGHIRFTSTKEIGFLIEVTIPKLEEFILKEQEKND